MPRTGREIAHLLILCAVTFVLAGCASLGPQLPMTAPDELASLDGSPGIRTLSPDGQFEVLPSSLVAERLQAQLGKGGPLSILALSGGGAGGAFGAGAIVGLTRGGTRPEFSVVSGVSVGALVAPFAFLGPEWDDEVKAIYTEGASEGLLQPRVIGALFGSSMYSGYPLQRLIDRYADDSMIRAIAAEAAKGRLLLVGTTDLASGEPVIWDLGSIALNGGPEARQLFCKVLLASASIPGMFPPVVIRYRASSGIRQETHVDGGVTMPFFIAPAPADLPQFAGDGTQRTVVRVVIDTRLRDSPRAVTARAASIFGRSIAAGLNRMMRATLESAVTSTRQRGISLEFAAIPVSYPLPRAFDFAPDAQRSLFEYASTCAQDGRLWTSAQQSRDVRVPKGPTVGEDAKCPADDSFIGRFAAVEN